MTEMDFEELDKAVSNLMEKAGATSSSKSQTSASSDGASSPQPSAKSSDTSVEPESSSRSVAEKRQRKFMDFVPASKPSSPAGDNKTTARPPKRYGVTLQPTTPSVEPAKPTEPEQPAQEVAENVQVSPEQHADSAHVDVAHFSFDAEPSTNNETSSPEVNIDVATDNVKSLFVSAEEFPDPIDFANAQDQMSPSSSPEDGNVPGPESPEDLQEKIRSAQSSTDIPLTSPFLPDAKVEKRPLGAPAPIDEKQAPDPGPTDDTQTSPSLSEPDPSLGDEIKVSSEQYEKPDSGELTAATLPAELTGAIMAVESAAVLHAEDHIDNMNPKPADSPSEPVSEPTEEQKKDQTTDEPSAVSDQKDENQAASNMSSTDADDASASDKETPAERKDKEPKALPEEPAKPADKPVDSPAVAPVPVGKKPDDADQPKPAASSSNRSGWPKTIEPPSDRLNPGRYSSNTKSSQMMPRSKTVRFTIPNPIISRSNTRQNARPVW